MLNKIDLFTIKYFKEISWTVISLCCLAVIFSLLSGNFFLAIVNGMIAILNYMNYISYRE
jgi:hypothetical protein